MLGGRGGRRISREEHQSVSLEVSGSKVLVLHTGASYAIGFDIPVVPCLPQSRELPAMSTFSNIRFRICLVGMRNSVGGRMRDLDDITVRPATRCLHKKRVSVSSMSRSTYRDHGGACFR